MRLVTHHAQESEGYCHFEDVRSSLDGEDLKAWDTYWESDPSSEVDRSGAEGLRSEAYSIRYALEEGIPSLERQRARDSVCLADNRLSNSIIFLKVLIDHAVTILPPHGARFCSNAMSFMFPGVLGNPFGSVIHNFIPDFVLGLNLQSSQLAFPVFVVCEMEDATRLWAEAGNVCSSARLVTSKIEIRGRAYRLGNLHARRPHGGCHGRQFEGRRLERGL